MGLVEPSTYTGGCRGWGLAATEQRRQDGVVTPLEDDTALSPCSIFTGGGGSTEEEEATAAAEVEAETSPAASTLILIAPAPLLL